MLYRQEYPGKKLQVIDAYEAVPGKLSENLCVFCGGIKESAMSQGKKQPAGWAQFVWQLLQAQGQKLVKEGKALETGTENLAELKEQARKFGEKQVPELWALGVV